MFSSQETEASESPAIPVTVLEILKNRADLLRLVRQFFDDHEYCEVETPVLSRDTVVDAHLEPFRTQHFDGTTLYLQTSPEFAMKRLVAAGAAAIYQISKVFRQEESGRLHHPEFTMLEWYRVGDTYHDQMDFTQRFVQHIMHRFQPETATVPFERITYDAAFEKHVGTRVLRLSVGELRELALSQGIQPPDSLTDEDRDEWLNLLLAVCVEPHLGVDRPTFLFDYPASQAALAVIRTDNPAVAERFELYVGGMELCNGYQELTDADELRRRNVVQAEIRARTGRPQLPLESRLLQAMQTGLPACSGVALGIDRLALSAFGGTNLRDVMPFPFEHA